jgi:hypothetical protein
MLASCGKSDSGGNTPEPEPVPKPSAATLVFPDDKTECNEGVIKNETQSDVTFQWNASQNTDTYEVNVRNLETNATSKTSASDNEAVITLLRGFPYEWYVVSKASGTSETATSAKWKFYNQGPGVENYAPFPAEVVNPLRGSSVSDSGTIALEWQGSDVDDDIVEYEVFFGTDETPSSSLGTTSSTTMDADIVSGQVYYWVVITKDSKGNTSKSEIFDFRVD